MRKITPSFLRAQTDVTKLDDLLILPHPLSAVEYLGVAEEARRTRLLEQLGETSDEKVYDRPTTLVHLIELLYMERHAMNDRRRTTNELQLPEPLKRHLAHHRETLHLGEDRFAIVPSIPFAGFGYAVEMDGLIAQTVDLFKLYRLRGIRQLAFLQHELMVREDGACLMATTFPHTRYQHILDVMAIATLIGRNAGLSRVDLHTLRFAALTHDALTPAGGDTVKLVDPVAFDEDLHYPELLRKTDWEWLRRRYRLDPELLAATVMGKGILGTLLDLADKMAYVARDMDQFLQTQTNDVIKHHVTAHPNFCALWDAVRIVDGRVVLTDADRLFDFLALRVLLFRELYTHTRSRFNEIVLAKFAVETLYQNGKLTREKLLTMDDLDLERCISEAFGPSFLHWQTPLPVTPRAESFASREAAERREHEVMEDGHAFTLIEDLAARIKPCTHYLVRTTRGKIAPFHEACPAEARMLDALAHPPNPVHLYILNPHP